MQSWNVSCRWCQWRQQASHLVSHPLQVSLTMRAVVLNAVLDCVMQVVPVASASMLSAEALAAQQAAEAAEYKRLQAELQAWCQGTALAGLLAAFFFYSKVSSWQPFLPERFDLSGMLHDVSCSCHELCWLWCALPFSSDHSSAVGCFLLLQS